LERYFISAFSASPFYDEIRIMPDPKDPTASRLPEPKTPASETESFGAKLRNKVKKRKTKRRPKK
jgi:hypothetical protein